MHTAFNVVAISVHVRCHMTPRLPPQVSTHTMHGYKLLVSYTNLRSCPYAGLLVSVRFVRVWRRDGLLLAARRIECQAVVALLGMHRCSAPELTRQSCERLSLLVCS